MGDLCTFTHFSIVKWCAVVSLQLIYMIYGKQVMSADFIVALSRHLSRFEPSLRSPYARYAHSQFEPSRLSWAAIVYRHILLGENSFNIIRTRAHEKIRLDFFRAEPLYILYIAGKNVKNCKVRSYLCPLDSSIFYFIWVKHGGKIW